MAGTGAEDNPVEDNAGTTNDSSPSGPVSPVSQGYFFRSDSGVDDDSMVDFNEVGVVGPKPELLGFEQQRLDLWTWP